MVKTSQQQKVLELELALWRHFVNTGGGGSWQEVKSPLGNQFQWPELLPPIGQNWEYWPVIGQWWGDHPGTTSLGLRSAHNKWLVPPNRRNFEPSLGGPGAVTEHYNNLCVKAKASTSPKLPSNLHFCGFPIASCIKEWCLMTSLKPARTKLKSRNKIRGDF